MTMGSSGGDKLIQQVIDSDLSTDERAVLLAYVFDRGRPWFRWKAIGQWTGHPKKEVLELRDSLIRRGWLVPMADRYHGDYYEIRGAIET